jgi:hypothetical protein
MNEFVVIMTTLISTCIFSTQAQHHIQDTSKFKQKRPFHSYSTYFDSQPKQAVVRKRKSNNNNNKNHKQPSLTLGINLCGPLLQASWSHPTAI